jgi:hypothetical protein
MTRQMARNVHWPRYESSNSGRSDSGSGRSYETETDITVYSDERPSLAHSEMGSARVETSDAGYFGTHHEADQYETPAPRASVDTYASTSEEDLGEDLDDMPAYQIPQYHHEPRPCDAIPTTPRDFAELFPTGKRISIRHDDATIDGNMNLRVDTQVEESGHRKQSYTLFHLRMQDLRTREFSLRRYCRESGREVCHSIRKYQKAPTDKKPVLQRASTALASLVKTDSRPSTSSGLKRSDSGYESVPGMLEEEHGEARPKSVGYSSKGRALIPTNTIKLEFSNYAHLDVKRRGAKSYKKYAFEYWGYDYSWKRIVKKEQDRDTISYYLVRDDNDEEPLAHICPVRLTAEEIHEEQARGGWVPPCYMRITDEHILRSDTDISE